MQRTTRLHAEQKHSLALPSLMCDTAVLWQDAVFFVSMQVLGVHPGEFFIKTDLGRFCVFCALVLRTALGMLALVVLQVLCRTLSTNVYRRSMPALQHARVATCGMQQSARNARSNCGNRMRSVQRPSPTVRCGVVLLSRQARLIRPMGASAPPGLRFARALQHVKLRCGAFASGEARADRGAAACDTACTANASRVYPHARGGAHDQPVVALKPQDGASR
jgi:hypothetical protein